VRGEAPVAVDERHGEHRRRKLASAISLSFATVPAEDLAVDQPERAEMNRCPIGDNARWQGVSDRVRFST